MPLIQSPTEKAFEQNVQTLIAEGKEQEQAVAIAMDIQRKSSSMAQSGASNEDVYCKKTYVAQVLPEGDLHDGERIIPLSDDNFRETVFNSISEGVSSFSPGILKEHTPDGQSYGYVTKMFQKGKELYAKFVLRKDVAQEFEDGKYRYVSPTLAWGFTDDSGTKVPARLLELSFVGIPRNATRQIPLTDLNEIGMDVSQMGLSNLLNGGNITISQLSVPLFEEQEQTQIEETNMDLEKLTEVITEIVATQMEAAKAEIMESLAPKTEEKVEEEVKEEEVKTEAAEEAEEEVKADEAEVKADAEEVKVDEDREAAEEVEEEEDKSEMSAVSTLSELAQANAKIAELEGVIAEMKAVALVDADIASRPHLSSMREKLIDVAKKDDDLYKTVVSLAPAKASKSSLAQRITANAQPTEVKDVMTLAKEVASKEGISFAQAYKKVAK